MIAQRLRALTVADPVRAVLALVSLWIATGGAVLALSLAQRVNQYLALRTSGGLVLTVLNAAQTPDGRLEYQDPPVFTAGLAGRLRQDYTEIAAASAMDGRWFDRMEVEATLYRPRSVMGAEPDYAQVVGLDMVAGRFVDEGDMTEQRHVVVLAAEAARTLFGDPQRALGAQIFRHYRQEIRLPEGSQGWRWVKWGILVVGVFRDPPPLLRDLYGIPDFIVPLTMSRDPGEPTSTLRVRIVGQDERRAIQRLEEVLRAHLGQKTALSVWRGGGAGSDPVIRRSRRERAGVSIIMGLFASAALLVSGVGLLAVMAAESMEREREAGIRRSLGATRANLILAGGLRALVPAALGLVAGTLSALVLAPQAFGAMLPILYADADVFRALDISQGVALPAVVITWAVTLILALAAGTLPQASLLGARAAENLRG